MSVVLKVRNLALDGQQTHEKKLNITHYLKNANLIQRGITSHQSKWPSSRNLQTTNAEEDVEKREPSNTVSRNVN